MKICLKPKSEVRTSKIITRDITVHRYRNIQREIFLFAGYEDKTEEDLVKVQILTDNSTESSSDWMPMSLEALTGCLKAAFKEMNEKE